MMQLENYLRLYAGQYPDKLAVIASDASLTYASLWQEVRECAGRLMAQSLCPGHARLIRATQDAAFLVDYLATHLSGGVAVPLERDIPEGRYREIERLLDGTDIPEEIADILFTTGTTGQSKGVMISHKALLADAENLAEAQGFSPDLTFIISGPLNHIGSLSKVWPTILTGGTLHILDGLKDLNAFFSILETPGRYATFQVPAALRLLMSLANDRLAACADRIDFIETGAAPLAQADMEHLCRLLPHSRLYNTYASTETGIVCTHDYNDGLCQAGCLGRPMKHSRVFITAEGTVACQGETLMTGYVGSPEMTVSVLRDGTLYTNDRGRLDADGRLHLAGRTDDLINVGGFKVSPAEVEEAALSLPGVHDCICVGVPHPMTGHQLKLLVVLDKGVPLDKKSLARQLHAHLEAYKVPLQYEEVEAVRRTFNGKIDRKAYKINEE